MARVSTPAPGAVNGVALANGVMPSIRVLIADDSSLFRDGLSNLVSTQKDLHVAGTVDSAATANEQMRLLKPDIVLLGWPASAPASQRIFAAVQDGKLQTRIIMMVSDDGKEDFVEAIRLGCSGIVPKTTSTELLLKSIRKVHAGEIWLDRMSTADVIRRLSKKGPPTSAAKRQGLQRSGRCVEYTRARNRRPDCSGLQKIKIWRSGSSSAEQTVKNHLHNIFDKLGVSDRLELALYAIHHKLHDGVPRVQLQSRDREGAVAQAPQSYFFLGSTNGAGFPAVEAACTVAVAPAPAAVAPAPEDPCASGAPGAPGLDDEPCGPDAPAPPASSPGLY